MGHEKSSGVQYPEVLATRWLVWLAQNLKANGSTIFLLEDLQPTWLERRWQHVAYIALLGTVFGLVLAGMVTLAWLSSNGLERSDNKTIDWWIWWLGTSLCLFLFIGTQRGINQLTGGLLQRAARDYWYVSATKIVVAAGIWMGIWLLIWDALSMFGLLEGDATLTEGSKDVIRWHWLEIGVILALLTALRLNRTRFIETVESIQWSWRLSAFGALGGCVFGAFLAVVTSSPKNLALYSPMSAVILALIAGLLSRRIDTKTLPNQGMILSWKNAIRSFLISFPLLSVVVATNLYLMRDGQNWSGLAPAEFLQWSFSMATVFGCTFFLWFGGLDLLKHYTLRLILWATRQAPGNFVCFLNYAVDELNFLQRVGGGYMFIHRSLAEHFADHRIVPGAGSPADSTDA